MIIAIDGPSASGKGTVSKEVARRLGLDYLDTGLLYRAVADGVIQGNIDTKDVARIVDIAQHIDFTKLDANRLCEEEISAVASQIAPIPELRQALYDVQRQFPDGKKGAVIDGRDIGSVIFPDAELKVYITATAEVRAWRRFNQLQSMGKYATYDCVLQDIRARDLRDATRTTSPLKVTPGAVVIDTSELSVDEVVSIILEKALSLR